MSMLAFPRITHGPMSQLITCLLCSLETKVCLLVAVLRLLKVDWMITSSCSTLIIPGVLGMPTNPNLYPIDLIYVFQKKYYSGTYREMVIYVEACESGSVFEGRLLPNNLNIYITTASNAEESSWTLKTSLLLFPIGTNQGCDVVFSTSLVITRHIGGFPTESKALQMFTKWKATTCRLFLTYNLYDVVFVAVLYNDPQFL